MTKQTRDQLNVLIDAWEMRARKANFQATRTKDSNIIAKNEGEAKALGDCSHQLRQILRETR